MIESSHTYLFYGFSGRCNEASLRVGRKGSSPSGFPNSCDLLLLLHLATKMQRWGGSVDPAGLRAPTDSAQRRADSIDTSRWRPASRRLPPPPLLLAADVSYLAMRFAAVLFMENNWYFKHNAISRGYTIYIGLRAAGSLCIFVGGSNMRAMSLATLRVPHACSPPPWPS